ncbi:UbiA prenyltransferase [Laetiporus sulphureus 93-53]|uniref:4-hydroxybenzoate polyprenyltransferase, mitochondrial n=1 Tax=Laetiporus sulphureus 93-53 TaxID=1314785 RepID=A0A165C8B6_9APHY|nr:UbiA prenyltransferase [Laetiporus sulphureus 93-53]KZT02375.1 UbiA prenyltransferase [Laetiporus sulphureus 93-53]
MISTNPAGPSPSWWRPYWELARMHKFPAGSILVFWPCVWGYLLSPGSAGLSPRELTVHIFALLVGSTLLHSAACTINDICDIDFDRQVERTKNRPLVTGAVSIFGATVFLALQVLVFFAMLASVNQTALLCGTFGVFPLHAFYPLMKRITWWPQAWLGLAMNWGLPTAWLIAAPKDVKSTAMWALTFGAFCWTIVYDTIYGCQDREDDVTAGVKSTALLFGDFVKPILAMFATVFVASLGYAGVVTGRSAVYFVLAVGGCAAHLSWQLLTLRADNPEDCWRKFNANGYLGYIVAGGMLAERYLA